MTTNQDNQISKDTLKKAFAILDLAKSETSSKPKEEEDDLEKNREGDDKEENVDGLEKGSMGKSCEEQAGELLKSGVGKDEVVEQMVRKGFSLSESQTAVSKLCDEYSNEPNNGGQIETQGVSGLKKSFETFALGMDEKFEALGKILKSQHQQNELLKSEVSTLTKSLGDAHSEIEQLGNQPFPAKSVTNVRAIERFEKSEQGQLASGTNVNVFSMSNKEDRENLGNIMLEKAIDLRSNGRPSDSLEKAVSDLEIVKSISNEVKPMLRTMGIEVVS